MIKYRMERFIWPFSFVVFFNIDRLRRSHPSRLVGLQHNPPRYLESSHLLSRPWSPVRNSVTSQYLNPPYNPVLVRQLKHSLIHRYKHLRIQLHNLVIYHPSNHRCNLVFNYQQSLLNQMQCSRVHNQQYNFHRCQLYVHPLCHPLVRVYSHLLSCRVFLVYNQASRHLSVHNCSHASCLLWNLCLSFDAAIWSSYYTAECATIEAT